MIEVRRGRIHRNDSDDNKHPIPIVFLRAQEEGLSKNDMPAQAGIWRYAARCRAQAGAIYQAQVQRKARGPHEYSCCSSTYHA